MENKEQKNVKEPYEPPKLRKEGRLRDITCGSKS